MHGTGWYLDMSSKNPMIDAYLQHLRERNIKVASICHYCKQPTTGINSDGYRIIFVCGEHLRQEPDVILDTTMPGVIHYTYPNGKEPGLMDPNIGGFHGNANKDNSTID